MKTKNSSKPTPRRASPSPAKPVNPLALVRRKRSDNPASLYGPFVRDLRLLRDLALRTKNASSGPNVGKALDASFTLLALEYLYDGWDTAESAALLKAFDALVEVWRAGPRRHAEPKPEPSNVVSLADVIERRGRAAWQRRQAVRHAIGTAALEAAVAAVPPLKRGPFADDEEMSKVTT